MQVTTARSRTIALFLALMLALTFLAGCAAAPSATPSVTPSSIPSATTAPAAKTAAPTAAQSTATQAPPTPLSIGLLTNPNVISYDDNYMTKMLEEDLNVDLSFDLVPSNLDDAKTKLALMISSNTKLPDVIMIQFDLPTEYEYAQKGVIVKLNEYFENPEKIKNIMNIPDYDRDYVLSNIKAADGNIYSVPGFSRWWSNEAHIRMYINKVWLDNAGLAVPTTTDEYYNTLKALVNGDANGNGKRDEIGLVGSRNGWAQNPVMFLMSAFIEANDAKNYLYVTDNHVVSAAYVTDQWKKGLEFMKQLTDDGLLSPLSFTQDDTQLKALINQPDWLAVSVSTASASYFVDDLSKAMTLIPPLVGPDGYRVTPYNPPMPRRTWFITKDCQNPDVAFTVGERMIEWKYSYTNRYGEYGVEWTDDPKVTQNYVTKDGDEDVSFCWLNSSFWGNPQAKCWQGVGPFYRDFNVTVKEGVFSKDALPESFDNWTELYASYFPKNSISVLNYTEDELSKIEIAKTSIDAFVGEQTVAFITGNRPLSDWDSYLEQLSNMGLPAYLQAAQAAYDRSR